MAAGVAVFMCVIASVLFVFGRNPFSASLLLIGIVTYPCILIIRLEGFNFPYILFGLNLLFLLRSFWIVVSRQ